MSKTRAREKRPSVRGRPFAEIFAGLTSDDLSAIFCKRVDRNGPIPGHRPELGPCWIWTGERSSSDYGMLRHVGAHRIAMWLGTGEEPAGRHTLHRCDNPPCVRPSHLHYGTHADNMQEKVERGRASRPIKLTDEQAEQIRLRYAAGETGRELAASFGISQQQANRIAAGQTRKLEPVETDFRKMGLKDPRHKITPAQRVEIRARAASGERPTDLAAEFGIHSSSLSEIVHGRIRNKNPQPRVVLSDDEVRDLRAKYARGGVRIVDLGAEYGIHHSQVSRIINRRSHAGVS